MKTMLRVVWLVFSLVLLGTLVPAYAATPFFAENKFTENGIEWCEEEQQRFEVLGDFWLEHHRYSIEARVCANLYEDPLWEYTGDDRVKKLIERSAYYVDLEIAESQEEAKTGITDPTPADIPDETTEEETPDATQQEETKQVVERAMEEQVVQQPQVEQTSDGGCLIATATFSSELAPQVQQLREIRDNVVLNTQSGSAFLLVFNDFYYIFSPTIADLERQNQLFKETVKIAITPLLTTLSILAFVDIDSEGEMILYGMTILFLNLGIYAIAPALLLNRLKRRYL